ncbi:MAG: protein kinase, partial [Phycisphaerales bacterium]
MSAGVRARAKEIFADALGMAPAQREAFVDEACAGDARLRAVVDGLVAALQSASDFLAEPTIDGDAPEAGAGDAVGPGQAIGRYRLLRALGEGGFGVVYLAEQTRPVTRRVALKILKLGMDSKRVVARFEAERQALALMDHPCIASVLDAGTTEQGRPYFVMEYVQGEPITTHCV